MIVRLTLAVGGNPVAGRFLFGGDAEVGVWEKIRDRYSDADLTYDVLMAPHHCSWHSLSWDSWSQMREKAKVSARARSALAQAAPGAIVVASSNSVIDDDRDPPCIRAKREYDAILKPVLGLFRCVADEPGDDPLEITVSYFGVKPSRIIAGVTVGLATGVGGEALAHG